MDSLPVVKFVDLRRQPKKSISSSSHFKSLSAFLSVCLFVCLFVGPMGMLLLLLLAAIAPCKSIAAAAALSLSVASNWKRTSARLALFHSSSSCFETNLNLNASQH